MIKKLSVRWLRDHNACEEGISWFRAQDETEPIAVVRKLMAENPDGQGFAWANWLVVRLMTRKQVASYAVSAAEQVLPIYEAKYPDDKRPHQAIKAAKAALKNDATAIGMVDTAYARTDAVAYAVAAATDAVAYATSYTAAARVACAAAYAATYAAHAAAVATDNKDTICNKIMNYGIRLLEAKPVESIRVV